VVKIKFLCLNVYVVFLICFKWVNYIYDVYYDVMMNHMPFSTDNL